MARCLARRGGVVVIVKPGYRRKVGARETALGFEMRPKGGIMFDPSLDYADPNLFVITDPQGWNSCGGASWGLRRHPERDGGLFAPASRPSP